MGYMLDNNDKRVIIFLFIFIFVLCCDVGYYEDIVTNMTLPACINQLTGSLASILETIRHARPLIGNSVCL
jgi:hypothetical protein